MPRLEPDQLKRLFELALRLLECFRSMSPKSRSTVYRLFGLDEQEKSDLESLVSDE